VYRNQLPSEKKGKGEEWPGEWNRGKKRKDREKRREEKRREEKRREEKRRREVGNVVKSSTFIARAKQIYGS